MLKHLEEKEKFHPTPAHRQQVATVSGQHRSHGQSGSFKTEGSYEKKSNYAGQPEKNKLHQCAIHVIWSHNKNSPIWGEFISFYIFNWYNQDFFFFVNMDSPHKLVFQRFQLH